MNTETIKTQCFCSKCGYIVFIDREMNLTDNGYYIPITNDPILCPKCNKKAFYHLNGFTAFRAVGYILTEIQKIKQANSSEAITFLSNILDVK